MENESSKMCPVFPDLVCPQGGDTVRDCAVRVSGHYDPMVYFKDLLLLHCALYQSQKEKEISNQRKK